MKRINIKSFLLFLTVIAIVFSLSSCGADCAHVDENADCVCELCEGSFHVDSEDDDKACDKCGTSVWIESFSTKFESFVGVNPFTMVFAWINLVILYFVLKKLAFKPIKNMIDSRQKEIDDMYSGAEAAQRDANAAKVEYEEKLRAANEEGEEILKRAVRRAQLREEEILHEADEKAQRVLERAEEEIELEKKRAINEVKNEVSGMAIEIASAVIERDVDQREHEAMIDDFIKNMGNEK